MPKQKTSEVESTDKELSPPVVERKKIGKFRLVSKAHVNEALTSYLRSLSMIEDNQEVTDFNKVPNALDVRIETI